MEQTIGKRIARLRKSRGMTQDQLAERVGVSAQAVSKWENDVSCPDISLLPKLAEIFQVTTDSLLGMPEKTEIVPAAPKSSGIHVNIGKDEGSEPDEERNGFTFNFDLGGKELPWFATAVLLFAVALLLNRTLLSGLGDAGVWDLMWPSALLALGLTSLWQRIGAWSVGLTAVGVYFLLVKMHILSGFPKLTWGVVVPVLLVLWAISMFADHFTGRKRGKHVSVDGDGKATKELHMEDGTLSFEGTFGNETVTVTEDCFRGGDVEVSFGSYTLDFTGSDCLEPDSSLDAEVSFGSLTLLLPRSWRVEVESDRSASSVSTHGQPDDGAGQTLTVDADLSFSSLDIRWP